MGLTAIRFNQIAETGLDAVNIDDSKGRGSDRKTASEDQAGEKTSVWAHSLRLAEKRYYKRLYFWS